MFPVGLHNSLRIQIEISRKQFCKRWVATSAMMMMISTFFLFLINEFTIYMVVQFLLFFDIFLFIHDGIMFPLDAGFSSCDSCEKEYLNKLPRLCWVMTVTSGWPYGFSPSTLFSLSSIERFHSRDQ